MKLTKEHIGKKVRDVSWPKDVWIILEWIRGDAIAGLAENGDVFYDEFIGGSEHWIIIVEEPGKPSARINEIYSGILSSHKCYVPCEICSDAERNAIIKFLDEEWEKKK